MKIDYVIAIDGPSGSGKSTVARELAKALGYLYIDTGAMYRAAALAAKAKGVDLESPAELALFLKELTIRQETTGQGVRTLLGEEDVSERIRVGEMGMMASTISKKPEVRERLVAIQREMGAKKRVVMEGRDIGTVVFPDADCKFFLTAQDEERARRRRLELEQKGEKKSLEEVLRDIRKRDEQDKKREVAPLRQAKDAIKIDSTERSVEKVVEELKDIIIKRGKNDDKAK